MAFRNASGTALDEYKEKVPRMSLNQLLQANRKHLPFEGEIEDFATLVEMHHFAQKVYSIDTPEKLLEQKAYWSRAVKVTKSFVRLLSKASQDVISHIKSLETKGRMERELVVREQQKREIARVKAEAQAVASQIRAR